VRAMCVFCVRPLQLTASLAAAEASLGAKQASFDSELASLHATLSATADANTGLQRAAVARTQELLQLQGQVRVVIAAAAFVVAVQYGCGFPLF
jgi:hypothetical protein